MDMGNIRLTSSSPTEKEDTRCKAVSTSWGSCCAPFDPRGQWGYYSQERVHKRCDQATRETGNRGVPFRERLYDVLEPSTIGIPLMYGGIAAGAGLALLGEKGDTPGDIRTTVGRRFNRINSARGGSHRGRGR
jgi:hypothetical protein